MSFLLPGLLFWSAAKFENFGLTSNAKVCEMEIWLLRSRSTTHQMPISEAASAATLDTTQPKLNGQVVEVAAAIDSSNSILPILAAG